MSAEAADLLESRIRISPLMTVQEAADYLGVGKRTIWYWIGQGKLTSHRLSSRCTRIKRRDVETLVDANTRMID